jgi:hypothetical protein
LGTKKEHGRTSPESDKILSFIIGNPSTYEEIGKGIGKTQHRAGTLVAHLKRKNKARSVNIELGRRNHKRTFHSEQLIGGLTDKSIAYLPGEERLLGEKITEYLPEELTIGMRKSLTHKLKSILPKEAFDVVHSYMNGHAVNR